MGCSQGDDAVHARIGTRRGAQPGARGQPPHAVAQQHRGAPRDGRGTAHGVIDLRHIAVNGAQRRLQRHRHMGVAARTQPAHPGVPDPPVAHKAMHQHHAPARRAPCLRGGQPVRAGRVAERLTPTEQQRRHARFGPPGTQTLPAARARRRIATVDAPHQRELQPQPCQAPQRQHGQPPQCHGGRTGPLPGQPGGCGAQEREREGLLPAGVHSRENSLFDSCPRLLHGP